MGAARESVERNGGRGLYPGVFLLGGRAGKVTEAMPTEGTKSDRGHTQVQEGVGKMQMKGEGIRASNLGRKHRVCGVLVANVTDRSITWETGR